MPRSVIELLTTKAPRLVTLACAGLLVAVIGCSPAAPTTDDGSNPDNANIVEDETLADDSADASANIPAEEVELQELLAAVKSDEEAAAEKYDGKKLKLTGFIHDLDADFMNHGFPARAIVTTEALESYDISVLTKSILCETVGRLPWEVCNVGDKVVVEGTAKVAYGGVRLQNSLIESPDGSPAPKYSVEEFAKLLEADIPAAKEKFDGQWVTLTGKVVDNIREQDSNHQLILYKSDQAIIQAEYSNAGKHPLNDVEIGDSVTIGDVITTFETDGVRTFHFSLPFVKVNE
ncbi:MAG: hypothetical protein NXI22_02380 [bacterium]|nr:hypothetical protein [bacterium]